MEIEVTRTSEASPDDVWTVMTDLERSADVVSGIDSIERLDGGSGFGVGTRWRETRTMFGRTASEELAVVEHDDVRRRYVVQAENGGTTYRSVVSVDPAGTGSRLRMTLGAEVSGLANRLMARTIGKAFEGATRKALEQDLADIADAAERATA